MFRICTIPLIKHHLVGLQSFLSAYTREALARASERLALCPEPEVLIAHVRSAEQDGLAWLEGESFFPDQLAVDYGYSPRAWRRWPFAFVRVFDRPLPSPRQPGALTVARWLNGRDADAGEPFWPPEPIAISMERLDAWERRTAALALPRLIASADLAAGFARASPLAHGNIVIGAMIAERCCVADTRLSAGGIAAIGLKARHAPWRALVGGQTDEDLAETSEQARDERCRITWLEALAAGAGAVVSLDKQLRLWLARVDAACEGRRKSSHLRALALLAGKSPSLTAARAAKVLGLSRQATTRLIAEACTRHLLREITHGNAFRRYVIAA